MRTRSTLATLVALVSLLGLVLVNVGGASGLHEGGVTDTDFLGLHIDTDDDYFYHDGLDQQLLTTSQCLVNDAPATGSLVSFAGSNKGLGLSFDSLGVRSKGPGRSCGRTSDSESFEISINNAPADALNGLNFDKMELDIEAKQDVVVVATTYLGDSDGEVFTLRTGGSATGDTTYAATSTSGAGAIANCLQGVSDSGSDNGANDNCRWTVDPDLPFDRVTFTALEGGEFGLEGGEDGTPAGPSAPESANSDSLFYLTDVGVLDCGDTVETGDVLGDPFVSVTRQFQTGCQLKEFVLGSGAFPPDVGDGVQSFTFEPSGGGAGQAGATFDMTVTWVKEPAVNPLPVTKMDYDGDGNSDGFLLWCEGTTVAPSLPSGVPWCRVEQHVTVVSTGYVQVVEHLFGTEDPSGWR